MKVFFWFSKNSFKGKKIQTLELVDNPIGKIDPEAFEGLVETEALTISNSKLTAINSEGKNWS
jgi:hypothetical protein